MYWYALNVYHVFVCISCLVCIGMYTCYVQVFSCIDRY